VRRLAAAKASGHYNSLTTPIGTLLDNPAAKAVLERHIPDVIHSDKINMARGVTLDSLKFYMRQIWPRKRSIMGRTRAGPWKSPIRANSPVDHRQSRLGSKPRSPERGRL
jgi:hypothetical protein